MFSCGHHNGGRFVLDCPSDLLARAQAAKRSQYHLRERVVLTSERELPDTYRERDGQPADTPC